MMSWRVGRKDVFLILIISYIILKLIHYSSFFFKDYELEINQKSDMETKNAF